MNTKPYPVPALGAALLLAALLASCGPSAAARKAEADRRAAAEARVSEALASARGDARAELAGRREALRIEVMELGDLDRAMGEYAASEALLSRDPESRVYLAVAQAMKAGQVKKIEDKLLWLRRGTSGFDRLREDFPDSEVVYLYQASTYSNFPPEVGAKDETLDIMGALRDAYAEGHWTLTKDKAAQLAYVYRNLLANYGDAASKAEIGGSAARAAAELPLFAATQGGRP